MEKATIFTMEIKQQALEGIKIDKSDNLLGLILSKFSEIKGFELISQNDYLEGLLRLLQIQPMTPYLEQTILKLITKKEILLSSKRKNLQLLLTMLSHHSKKF